MATFTVIKDNGPDHGKLTILDHYDNDKNPLPDKRFVPEEYYGRLLPGECVAEAVERVERERNQNQNEAI